ncbi:Uma2 family endonuclease [Meiothermus sp.]|uniref:Uma2 family endonuclease n=1 Tax=Meiothermus sp. TaxID=1955249 RepID=UPI00307F8FA2
MPRPQPVAQTSFEAFLELEARSQTRHEFVNGLLFAMAGGTDYHNIIAGNIFVAAKEAAKGTGCTVFIENMLLQTPEGPTYYPDVFVTCEEANDGARFKRFPCLVVEVLSETTSDIDRGEKLHNYSKIPSLKAYVLVSHDRRLVETYRRLSDATWRYETLEKSGALELPCLDTKLSLDEIYAGVDFLKIGS